MEGTANLKFIVRVTTNLKEVSKLGHHGSISVVLHPLDNTPSVELQLNLFRPNRLHTETAYQVLHSPEFPVVRKLGERHRVTEFPIPILYFFPQPSQINESQSNNETWITP
jgi:hypothetical protein